jgi:acyl-CoA thioesterase
MLFAMHDDHGNGLQTARTDPDFWNQIGPHGGWLAAVAMRAMRDSLPQGFLPRSFNCTFIDHVDPGEFRLKVSSVARKRTLEVREVELSQSGRVCVAAQGIFGPDREHPPLASGRPEALPPPDGLDPLAFMSRLALFPGRFDYRLASGAAFGGQGPSRTMGYVRLKAHHGELRPEDLLLLADSWFPAFWTQTLHPVPATTVTMSVVFQASAAREVPAGGFVQVDIASSAVRDGYADETAELWIPGGPLLLKAQQLLWLKFDRTHQALPERDRLPT